MKVSSHSLASVLFLSSTIWLVSVGSGRLVSYVVVWFLLRTPIVVWLSLGGAACHVFITCWRSLSRGYYLFAQFVTCLSLGGGLSRGCHLVEQFVTWLSLVCPVCHVFVTWWCSLSRGCHLVAHFVTWLSLGSSLSRG
jgi:hypothetical protein